MSSTDFNAENHVMLEQALLKLPHFLMRQNFKTSQKYLERESSYLNSAATDALNKCLNGSATLDDSIKQVDLMISRMENLKRKLENLNEDEEVLMTKSKARIGYLQDLYSINSTDDKEYEKWSRIRLHRLLVDHLLRQGYSESALALIDTNDNIKDLVDVNVLLQCKNIEQSLRKRSTAECLAWCQENKSYLKKANSSLEFDVRLQQYIELIREGKPIEAIKYSAKYLVSNADSQIQSILKASALLVFPPSNADENPYEELYSQERWDKLADTFVATLYSLHGLSKPSLLQICLSAGLSALKTPSCKEGNHKSISFTSTYNSSLCPICSQELSELSKSLPYAHHVRSSVEIDPVMLPNGTIYGAQSLLEFCAKAGVPAGKMRDPATEEDFDESSLRRVFPS
ncbi:CTLH/CRA C-terminal to lish motif domain-containing protein [Dipodascopsis uninucleata]